MFTPQPIWKQVTAFLKLGAYIKVGKRINGSKNTYYLLNAANSPFLYISENNFNKLLKTYRRIQQNAVTGFYEYNPTGRRVKKNLKHQPKAKKSQLSLKIKGKNNYSSIKSKSCQFK